MYLDEDCVSTNTSSRQKNEHVLTQEELAKWWPFTRLDPKRFPKEKKRDPTEGLEEAPF